MLDPIETYDKETQRWQVSKKIRHAIKIIKTLDAQEFPDLVENLRTCIDLFEDRNKFVHGRLYGNFDRPDTLKSGRPNVPEQEIHPDELYTLANALSAFRAVIYRPMMFKIPRALYAKLKQENQRDS